MEQLFSELEEEFIPGLKTLTESIPLLNKSNPQATGYYIGIPEHPVLVYPANWDPKKLPLYCTINWKLQSLAIDSTPSSDQSRGSASKGYFLGIPEQPIFCYPANTNPQQLPSHCNVSWQFVDAAPCGAVSPTLPFPLVSHAVEHFSQEPVSLDQTSYKSKKEKSAHEAHSFVGSNYDKLAAAEHIKRIHSQSEQDTRKKTAKDCSDEECKKKLKNKKSSLKESDHLSIYETHFLSSVASRSSLEIIQWGEDRYKDLILQTYRKTAQKHEWQARKEKETEEPLQSAAPAASIAPPTPHSELSLKISAAAKKNRKK